MRAVKDLREAEGWTQNQLAFHAGLATSVISQVENGKRDPSASTLKKLAEALRVNVSDLFRGEETPKVQAPPSKEAGRRDAWADSYARLGERLAWEWGLEFDVRMEHRDFEWLMRVLEATKDYQKLMSGIPQTTRSLEGAESLVGFLDNALPKFKKAIDKTEDPGLQEHYESILKESGLLLSGKDA